MNDRPSCASEFADIPKEKLYEIDLNMNIQSILVRVWTEFYKVCLVDLLQLVSEKSLRIQLVL